MVHGKLNDNFHRLNITNLHYLKNLGTKAIQINVDIRSIPADSLIPILLPISAIFNNYPSHAKLGNIIIMIVWIQMKAESSFYSNVTGV